MNKERTLIYGCMGLGGGWNTEPISGEDERRAFEAVDAALEIGIRVFDHADIYTRGKAEEVFGRILAARPGLRDKIVLQSKAGIRLGEGPKGSNVYDLSAEYLRARVHHILKRLGTDYLDVFLLHRPDPLAEPGEIVEAFHHLKTQGLVRSFGVSNFSAARTEELARLWPDPLAAQQIQLSLGHRLLLDPDPETNTGEAPGDFGLGGLIPLCRRLGLPVQAWGSLDRGLYTERSWDSLSGRDLETARLLRQIADGHNTAPASVALAWLFALPLKVQPVIGTTSPERIRSCADAQELRLSRDEWYALWISARGRPLP